MISFARNSKQCDTLKIKYAIFLKPDQKSLEVCGKNSSGFTKVESGSIIHESCFHHMEKKRPQFSILHWLNLDLHFICPWTFNALIPAKICEYKTSIVTSLLSLPGGTDIKYSFLQRFTWFWNLSDALRPAWTDCVFVGAATEQKILSV